jgi:glycosyltransferase involved in cell wall biosynthesis
MNGIAVSSSARPHRHLLILGTRGIPAAHGGFETFAEKLALYLVARGWQVTVYCQNAGVGKLCGTPVVDEWNGVRRVTISTSDDALGTVVFDWASIRHALGEAGLPLVLGYNTAVFATRLRLHGLPVLMNMDGIEWKRAKWGMVAKAWFYLNEWCGERCATKLIADHPRIFEHLARRRRSDDIVTIAYGADAVIAADEAPVRALGLEPGRYFLSIGRIEPENSTLELVRAFASASRHSRFVCLGKLEPEQNAYHAEVMTAANEQVLFPGAIYDQYVVKALRFHALAYCHGHTVGGTNPSLVEALGAGSAIIARDNVFNRWVAGEGPLYFADEKALAECYAHAETDASWRTACRQATRQRFEQNFTWEKILRSYERLLNAYS